MQRALEEGELVDTVQEIAAHRGTARELEEPTPVGAVLGQGGEPLLLITILDVLQVREVLERTHTRTLAVVPHVEAVAAEPGEVDERPVGPSCVLGDRPGNGAVATLELGQPGIVPPRCGTAVDVGSRSVAPRPHVPHFVRGEVLHEIAPRQQPPAGPRSDRTAQPCHVHASPPRDSRRHASTTGTVTRSTRRATVSRLSSKSSNP